MHSLDTYELLDVTLPAVLMAVVFVITLLAVLLGICSKGIIRDKPVPLMFQEMVKLAFPDLKKEGGKYQVFGKDIFPWCYAMLSIIVIPVITSTCLLLSGMCMQWMKQ